MPKMFKTTIAGIGPFCVEFEDGEIVTTRSEARQKLIHAAATLKHMVKWCIKHDGECLGDHAELLNAARAAIAELGDDKDRGFKDNVEYLDLDF